jgi:protein SHQ1
MPSIPRHSLSQTDTHLTVTLNLPFIRISAAETHIDGTSFSFSCKPYLLKLILPGRLIEDEAEPISAVYDHNVDNGTLTLTIKKIDEGEWPDLDLTSKLLMPRNSVPTAGKVKVSAPPLIEVIDSTTTTTAATVTTDDDNDGDNDTNSSSIAASPLLYDESIPDVELPVSTSIYNLNSTLPPPPTAATLAHPTYGFGSTFSRCFDSLRDELKEMCETDQIDSLQHADKRDLRLLVEKEKFDEERYCGDFFVNCPDFADANPDGADMLYLAAVDHTPDFVVSLDKLSLDEFKFTGDETAALQALPNKEHLLPATASREILLSLLDILYGYCYDNRLTTGDANVESAWTIAILSPTLSWFDTWKERDNTTAPLLAAARRSLVYPYLRYLDFSVSVVAADVLALLKRGKRHILRALLAVRGIFEKSESHYLLNRFYIDDYLLHMQKIDDAELRGFVDQLDADWAELVAGGLEKVKSALDLGLEDAEDLVRMDATGEE